MDSPFQILPEEIWCIILGCLETHQEFWNTLQALPELGAVLRRHSRLKRLWLFVEVFPLLMSRNRSYLLLSDLLNCRPVCKPWSDAVGLFLQNRPQPDHPDQGRLGGLGFNGKTILGRLCLMYFMSRMRDTPPERNPFPSRSLSLTLGPPAFGLRQVKHFLEDVLEFLQRYGEHIWYYKLEVDLNGENVVDLLSWVAQGLTHLSKLRDFHLTFKNAAGRELRQVKSLIESVQPCLVWSHSEWSHRGSLRIFSSADTHHN